MGIMPENRMRRWSKIFRRYGIPDDTPGTMEQEKKPDDARQQLKNQAIRTLFPTVEEPTSRKKK